MQIHRGQTYAFSQKTHRLKIIGRNDNPNTLGSYMLILLLNRNKMKIKVILLSFVVLLIFGSCDAEKEAAQRRNLMMPKKSDLPRNSKYAGSKEKKTYKVKKHKTKKKKKNFGY